MKKAEKVRNNCILSRFVKKLTILAGIGILLLTGCGQSAYDLPFEKSSYVSGSRYVSEEAKGKADSFASELCVISDDVLTGSVDASNAGTALLVDVKKHEVMYSKAAYEKMYPASLTKVMTALVALENGSLDQILTASENVKITESGAAAAGIKPGDTMTLDQALHILLIASSNDVALMIAENIGGTIEHFLEMMNDRAVTLGATGTHFKNPHGLTDLEHYTTGYDMYLIFNEALKFDTFSQIIGMSSYQTTYFDKNGKEIPFSSSTTNKYLRGQFQAPSNITVLGGKTGTTNAAGHCLILHSKDIKGNSYISVMMRCTNSDILYEEMTDLLDEISK